MIPWSLVLVVFLFWLAREVQFWLREQRQEAARAELERMLWARNADDLRAATPRVPSPPPPPPDPAEEKERRELRERVARSTGDPGIFRGLRNLSGRRPGGSA